MDLSYLGLAPALQLLYGALAILALGMAATWLEWESPARVAPGVPLARQYLSRDFLFCLLSLGFLAAIQLGQQLLLGAIGARPAGWLAATPEAYAAFSFFLVFVVHDFLMYWIHRFMHTKAAWRVHRWHHAIQRINWLSGVRSSLIEFILDTIPSLLLYLWFPGVVPWLLVYTVYTQTFIHLNVRTPAWFPTSVLVSPTYHRAHHGLDERLHNRNFGTFWVFWDRWFGTAADFEGLGESFEVGLGEDPFEVRRAIGI